MGNRLENDQLIGGFKVGDWLAQPMRNRISGDGVDAQVEPKVMEVLMCLARNSGKTVTKDTFFDEVWEGTFVSEDVLSRCISELRRVLKDDARNPEYIETIRKTGYRLIADAEPHVADDFPARTATAPVVEPARETVQPEVATADTQSETARIVTWIAVAMVVIGSISLAGIIVFRTVSSNAPVQRFTGQLHSVPYTSYRGLEIDPALSPSGDQMAFAWDDEAGSDFDIYLKQTGAESPLRLTNSPASERYPKWSPDGLRLAFARSTDTSHAVFTIPSIGGKERKVVDFNGRQIRGLTWSPSGDVMVVSAQMEIGGAASLYLVDLDSTGLVQLTRPPLSHFGDVQPSFSPDGEWLAFIRSLSHEVQDVYVMSMRDKHVRAVTADSFAVAGVDWMPDSRGLVFASDRGFVSSLWRASLTTTEPEWIVSAGPGIRFESPSLSRNSEKLSFVRRSSNTNLWSLTIDGDQVDTRPVIFSTGLDTHPSIAPNNDRLAFVSDRSGRPEVWVSDLDGSNLVQLTSNAGRPYTPRWSPNGRTLVFGLRVSGQSDIYTIDAEGGNPTRVTRGVSEDKYPNWSQDGRWIVFTSNRTGEWQLWRTRPDGSGSQQITRSGVIFGMPSLDGQGILYSPTDHTEIRQQRWNSSAGESELVVGNLSDCDYSNWVPAQTGIYYMNRRDHHTTLSFFDFARSETRSVHELRMVPQHPALAVQVGGDVIVYAQIDEEGGDIQMVETFR